jgi:hypothetical protein
MTDAQLARCRQGLEQFLVDLLEPVGRSERGRWGSVYIRGLLWDGEQKSIEPMAKRWPDGNEQAVQQFVGEPVGLGAGLGATGPAYGPRTGAGGGLGNR